MAQEGSRCGSAHRGPPYKLVLQIYPPSATGKPGIVPLAETETDPFPGGDA